MTALFKLDLSGNAVFSIPFFISNLTNLKELTMSRCSLTNLCFEIGDLPNLTNLDLSHNQLKTVPSQICKLTNLTGLNLMGNQLTALPDTIGNLRKLRIFGLKSNKLTQLPSSFTQLSSLVELFLTDNQLQALPEGFGSLQSLVKLQASFNSFTHLPQDLLYLPSLELMRIAVCQLKQLPDGIHPPAACSNTTSLQLELGERNETGSSSMELTPTPENDEADTTLDIYISAPGEGENVEKKLGGLEISDNASTQTVARAVLPRLSWFSLSGNPACAALPAPRSDLKIFQSGDVVMSGSTKLGEGASGEVSTATLAATGETVAVKVFRADVSPDGRTEEEIGISCSIDHPNLTFVIGMLPQPPCQAQHEAGVSQQPPLLIMRLVNGQPMAAKPTSQHLLRCKWAPDTTFTCHQVVKVAGGIASALAYLHSKNMCHGDVYAHNILVDFDSWHPTLCDFGASFVYHEGETLWQAMEVRAFGLFMKDLIDRLDVATPDEARSKLSALVQQSISEVVTARPSFKYLSESLSQIST